jgi:histidinol-phosphate phosphatase family protein
MMSDTKRPAVFLDKDGTLVEDLPPSRDGHRARLYPDTLTALRLLRRAGFALVVVTNQGAVAQGLIEEHHVKKMELYLRTRLLDADIPLAGFYYCPHHPDGLVEPYALHCLCRKPKPGLLLRAATDLRLDMDRSWMVGDILHDVEAGRWAGCRTVLLNNGHETEWHLTETRWPDYVAGSLLEAAQLIALTIPHSPLSSSSIR